MVITICGGGSLGHVCAGVLSSQEDVRVCILTRKPRDWGEHIDVTDCNGRLFTGTIDTVSDNPANVIPQSHIVLMCLPGFAIEEELNKIRPFLRKETVVGSIVSSTGFFFFAHRVLGNSAPLFGFQRTPFIARTTRYGHAANLLGYKSELAIACENIEDREEFRQTVEKLWLTPARLLNSYFEAALTNSNPILHTGRLYSMWKDWNGQTYDHNILFYKEWTVEASQVLIDMDAEFMNLVRALGVTEGAIPSLLEYYESTDAESLCRKISSIAAFQSITSPMTRVPGGWVPDFQSRYFTEDFPFGLHFIKQLAEEKEVPTPTIDKVYAWGMRFFVSL